MEMCSVNCKKNTANENSSVRKTKQNRSVLVLPKMSEYVKT